MRVISCEWVKARRLHAESSCIRELQSELEALHQKATQAAVGARALMSSNPSRGPNVPVQE